MQFALKNIINGVESYSRQYSYYRNAFKKSLSELLDESRVKIEERLAVLDHAFFPVVESNLYRNYKANDEIVENGKLKRNITSYTIGSQNGAKVCFEKGEEAKVLLEPLMENGRFVNIVENNLNVIQNFGKENLEKLDASHKRLSNPHIYGVGLDANLFNLQQDLIKAHQGR